MPDVPASPAPTDASTAPIGPPPPAGWKDRFFELARALVPVDRILAQLGVSRLDFMRARLDDPHFNRRVAVYYVALDQEIHDRAIEAARTGDLAAMAHYDVRVRPALFAPIDEPNAASRYHSQQRPLELPPDEPMDPEVTAAMIQAGLDAYDALQARKAAAEGQAGAPPTGAVLYELDVPAPTTAPPPPPQAVHLARRPSTGPASSLGAALRARAAGRPA